jgi:hypothetical protein
MTRNVSAVALLMAAVIVLTIAPPPSLAQSTLQSLGFAPHPAANAFDVALTYSPERGKISNTPCQCFWLEGGGANAALTLYRGLGIAASLTGQHASGLTGGSSLSKIDYLFGPRYTLHTSGKSDRRRYSTRIFGEALFGTVHAFAGTFPAPGQAATSANSFAYELGGGLDLSLAGGLGVRVFEASFYHSSLPNEASNTQDDIRLAVGVSYRLGR